MKAILFASIFTGVAAGLRWKFKRWKYNRSEAVQIPKLDKQLWKLLSRYVRSKDSDWRGYATCFTCGKQDDWRSMDCGHYLAKATTNSYLKFYEKNLAPQCVTCNRIKAGNYAVYKQKLIEKYGEGVINHLNALRQSSPLTVTDYQNKISYYTDQLKMLK